MPTRCWALLALAAAFAACVAADRASLRSCLEGEGIYTLTGADSAYQDARLLFSKFFEFWPTAVAYPASTEQVAAAVRCARRFRGGLHPRSGGHGNEGESVATGAITLDMTRMSRVRLLGRDGGTAGVQGGAHVGTVVAELWRQSNGTRGFPAGQRPVVGVAGYSLGGGFGTLTRLAGLGGDNIISLTAVDGRGRILKADARQNSDLLWAARGGGGGHIAIVTEFVSRTVDVSGPVTQVEALVPLELAPQALEWYQTWQGTLPRRFSIKASYGLDAANNVTVLFNGLCMGPAATCRAQLEASLAPGGALAAPRSLPWRYQEDTYLAHAVRGIGWEVPDGYTPLQAVASPEAWKQERSYYKYKSVVLKRPLSGAGIAALLRYARKGPRGSRVFEFDSLRGAVAAVPSGATAAANLRQANTVLVLRANSQDKGEATRALQDAAALIEELAGEVGSYRGYVNFLDTDAVGVGNWVDAFFGGAAPGLLCAARRFDPDNVFDQVLGLDRIEAPSRERCRALMRRAAEAAAAWSRELERTAPARA